MDFSNGNEALSQVMALLNESKEQERDFMKKMEGILAVATIHGNNSPTVTLLGEVLKLQKESAERKERCVEMLLEIDELLKSLIQDRGTLLLTISELEMEKDSILRKQNDPGEIYGPIYEAYRKMSRFEDENDGAAKTK